MDCTFNAPTFTVATWRADPLPLLLLAAARPGFPQTLRPREQRGLFKSLEEQVQPLEPQLSPGEGPVPWGPAGRSPQGLHCPSPRSPTVGCWLRPLGASHLPRKTWASLRRRQTQPFCGLSVADVGTAEGGGATGHFRWGLLCSSPLQGKCLKLQLLPKELDCP